jgi:hypothetical protein
MHRINSRLFAGFMVALALQAASGGRANAQEQIFTAVTGTWVELAPTAEVLNVDPGDGRNGIGNTIGNFRLNQISGRYIYRGNSNSGTLWPPISAAGKIINPRTAVVFNGR